MRVLIIEDEPEIGSMLVRALDRAGFIPTLVSDGEAGWAQGDTEPFILAILDMNLPRLDGLSILKRWRADGVKLPVLVASARGSWTERVDALNAGADDYIVKPFVLDEVIARMHAVLRRGAGKADNLIRDGDLTIDLRFRSVSDRSGQIDLTPLEFRILAALIRAPGETISQASLCEDVYGDHELRRENAIEAAVMRLRRKIGPNRIMTRRGYGYIWTLHDDLESK
ncbi:MAG: response regulator transcription factor [Aquidulcibacter sp.]|jgi:two-component system OmpR family response regulator|uniref:response regulator transcription factor n=1 Tax=Aquidulcibacter sp. TaxID=2052990 RepID=UPI0022BF760F|nr:response regulator transcription factor [Aquidulcibacter sp.]MCE2891943.1 response regulator transcription factor [Hyphomonadaceae bacterium]MCZ8209187.1 response regulator transcription factor [Aquidulcibacter sp.]